MSAATAVARVRGMVDLGEAALRRRAFVEAAFASVTNCYQFVGLQTPVVEPAALFTRSLGAASELVRKEMFLLAGKKEKKKKKKKLENWKIQKN
jgi:histidyl-tRNA synthetase